MKINSWGGPKTRGDCTIKEEIASVPLQLSKKGLWIKENLLSPRRRLITKALNRMHGKLGIFLLVVPRSNTFDEGDELQFMREWDSFQKNKWQLDFIVHYSLTDLQIKISLELWIKWWTKSSYVMKFIPFWRN